MRTLEHFEIFHISGAAVFYDFNNEFIHLSEQSDTFGLVFEGRSLYFERDKDGFVQASVEYNGNKHILPREFNIYSNMVGYYQANPAMLAVRI